MKDFSISLLTICGLTELEELCRQVRAIFGDAMKFNHTDREIRFELAPELAEQVAPTVAELLQDLVDP
jgi:hypothetical protein